MYCKNCGKEISNGANFCQECGALQQEMEQSCSKGDLENDVQVKSNIKKAPYNSLCIIGLVVSIISTFLNFFGIVGIAGTILSVMGLMSCKQKNENGRGVAIAGIILGGCSILYAVAILI